MFVMMLTFKKQIVEFFSRIQEYILILIIDGGTMLVVCNCNNVLF